MRAHIAMLPGDGIGPEVTREAVRVLRAVAKRFGHDLTFEHAAIGGEAIDTVGCPLPPDTLALCRRADAVLLGAVGGPQWDGAPPHLRPEQGLLGLRRELGLFANLRPVRLRPGLGARSPLRQDVVAGVDLVIVRELTGGIYFGARERGRDWASDQCRYTRSEIERVARIALDLARARSRRVASLDKANLLETSRLWRETVTQLHAAEYGDISLEHHLIDSAAMQVVTRPTAFDVILTENMFGDIISDEAAVLVGSLGLLGSACIGYSRPSLFEPIHGSAPSLAGRNVANPIGAVGSAALLLGEGLGLREEAIALEAAIDAVVAGGQLTPDCGGSASTEVVGGSIVEALRPAPSRPSAGARKRPRAEMPGAANRAETLQQPGA
ncbi:MAG: 3-isopropylmalate dehydrogenase [Phycisphaerales bacterium]|nr:3-isopropylmalate dehydrogenase [Phycisphaerales bacterium]